MTPPYVRRGSGGGSPSCRSKGLGDIEATAGLLLDLLKRADVVEA